MKCTHVIQLLREVILEREQCYFYFSNKVVLRGFEIFEGNSTLLHECSWSGDVFIQFSRHHKQFLKMLRRMISYTGTTVRYIHSWRIAQWIAWVNPSIAVLEWVPRWYLLQPETASTSEATLSQSVWWYSSGCFLWHSIMHVKHVNNWVQWSTFLWVTSGSCLVLGQMLLPTAFLMAATMSLTNSNWSAVSSTPLLASLLCSMSVIAE